jgi:hypothetical protein
MLVDSFSFTFDETAPSVDAQAQLLLEAGWRVPRRRFWEPSTHSPTAVPARVGAAVSAGVDGD